MLTPLDLFMVELQKRRKCDISSQSGNFSHTKERNTAPDAELECDTTLPTTPVLPSDSSIPDHTHTLEGFANTGAEMKCETKCEGSLTLPDAPLQPGWLVVYRDQRGVLCGGYDDRQHGTVRGCTWDGAAWCVTLADGQTLTLAAILSVGKTDAAGHVVAAWTVRTHGYDGGWTR